MLFSTFNVCYSQAEIVSIYDNARARERESSLVVYSVFKVWEMFANTLKLVMTGIGH